MGAPGMTIPVTVESAGGMSAPSGSLLGKSITEWRDMTRRELGLPARRVTGAGHQATPWHPGILAKFIWARVLAGPQGACIALVVDEDVYEPGEIRIPVLRAGKLESWTYASAPRARGLPAMSQPPWEPARLELDAGVTPALPEVAEGIERFRAALANHGREKSAALQAAAALLELAQPWTGPFQRVTSAELLATSLGAAIIGSMRRDPRACAEAFNAALSAAPRAAKPLRIGEEVELPIWNLGTGGRRERVTDRDLVEGSKIGAILPRAFLQSAIMRLGVCDRFVHGTGASIYERATDAWFRAWLGVTLPPIDIASATLTLPLPRLCPERPATRDGDGGGSRSGSSGSGDGSGSGGGGSGDRAPETPISERRAWWDPELLDRGSAGRPGAIKQALLRRLNAAPRRSPERREAYRSLLRELDSMRAARSEAFAAQRRRIAESAECVRSDSVAADRTWAFFLHHSAKIDALREALAAHAPEPSAGAAGSSGGSASGSGR